MKRTLTRSGVVIATCLAVVAGALSMPPASADGIVIDIPVTNITAPITLDTVITAGDLSAVSITIPPAGLGGRQVTTQCLDIPGIGRSCIGSPTDGEQPPLDFNGGENLAPLVKWSAEARAALDWMIPGGIEYIAALYDLPKDERILRYARPQLRQYIVAQLVQIMDKKAHGQPLSDDESNALAFVQGQYVKRDRLVAQAAWDEYLAFETSPCTYVPPTAPKVVTTPETMPKKVIDWCKLPKTQASEAFAFVPPLPSPQKFTAWGAYRHAQELGLTYFDDPVAVKNLTDMTLVGAAFSAFAIEAGKGLSLAGGTALASLAAIGTKLLPYASRAMFKAGVEMVANMSAAASGILATAIIAVAVVVFLVVTGVSIYLLIEHDSVAATLRDRVDTTAKETDPFNLANPDPVDPTYRSVDTINALSVNVAKWTTIYGEAPPGLPPTIVGTSVADPPGVWPGSATDESDSTWLVTTEGKAGNKAAVERKQISVPVKGGFATVRFSGGWMVVTDPGEDPRAALQFSYKNASGDPAQVTGAPGSGTDLIVTGQDGRGDPSETRTKTLSFKDSTGDLVRARLKSPPPTYLAGPRPVAVGPLTAGRPVMLRPNPVGTSGASLDETTVQDDYQFDWTVEHLDGPSGDWNDVAVPDGYGSRFVPTEPGEYDARVRMTSIDDPTQQVHGSVRFAVTSPPVTAPVQALQDNGINRLELDLQLLEEVPGDNITVDVTWPGELNQPDIKQTISLSCVQTGPIECTTPRTGPSNSLVFPLTSNTDLRRPVRVLATNSTGGTYEREFHLTGRPTFAPPQAGDNADEPGTVLVGEASTQVTLPLDASAGVQDYLAADLVPTAGGGQDFGLVDPTTGNTTAALLLPGLHQGVAEVFEDPGSGTWSLSVRGIPDISDIGSFEVPVVIRQTNGTQQLLLVVVNVVAATEDRYRGAIQSTVDPDDIAVSTLPALYPSILGGRVTDARYSGRMCVSLQHRDFGQPAVVRCGSASDFIDAKGQPTKLPYAKFFPTGMRSGTYRADTWLATAGSRVETSPMGATFILTQDASYPRPVVALGPVTITGRATVGRTLTAAFPPRDPAGAKVTYQWLRDGKPISRANAKTYKLNRNDRGHRMSVRVTATYPEWTKATKTSPRTTKVT